MNLKRQNPEKSSKTVSLKYVFFKIKYKQKYLEEREGICKVSSSVFEKEDFSENSKIQSKTTAWYNLLEFGL